MTDDSDGGPRAVKTTDSRRERDDRGDAEGGAAGDGADGDAGGRVGRDDAFDAPRTAEGDRSAMDVELDPFVRALAARRAEDAGETLDEFVVEAVKTYLAGLLGGDVDSPSLAGGERSLTVDADPVLEGLLDAIGGDAPPRDVVLNAIMNTYAVDPEERTMSVAGLRDHEAMLSGVVANGGNDLGDTSEVVQAAVEARLGIHDD